MKLFYVFTSNFLLMFVASFAYAESGDAVINYLSLNEKISFIHKKNTNKEEEFNKDILLAVSYFLIEKAEPKESGQDLSSLEVVATAYTSHVAQTDSTPTIAAWGDRLKPTTKAIAVSHDLLTKYGLKHRSKVRITGFSGEFLVLDKMNKRWKKKIDIYMGMNRKAAFKWGKRNVVLSWVKESV